MFCFYKPALSLVLRDWTLGFWMSWKGLATYIVVKDEKHPQKPSFKATVKSKLRIIAVEVWMPEKENKHETKTKTIIIIIGSFVRVRLQWPLARTVIGCLAELTKSWKTTLTFSTVPSQSRVKSTFYFHFDIQVAPTISLTTL
jgi:hypothetical protein